MVADVPSVLRRTALIPRTATVLVGAPLVVSAAWLGGLWWIGLVGMVVVVGAFEFVRLHGALTFSARGAVMAGTVFLAGVTAVLPPIPIRWVVLAGGLVALVAGVLPLLVARHSPRLSWTQRPWAIVLLGVVYLGIPAGVLARWRLGSTFEAVAWFFGLIWANDIAAYVVGLAVGRHRLAPRISPGKTWEGSVAGVAAAVAVALIGGPSLGVLAGAAMLFGAITSMASQIGDLFESALKRRAGVKDSGALLPGHGGVLDRFDGMLFAAPVGYLFLQIWGT